MHCWSDRSPRRDPPGVCVFCASPSLLPGAWQLLLGEDGVWGGGRPPLSAPCPEAEAAPPPLPVPSPGPLCLPRRLGPGTR